MPRRRAGSAEQQQGEHNDGNACRAVPATRDHWVLGSFGRLFGPVFTYMFS
jgi:hypothetical protein